ncbi:hypothetical protein OSTOST_23028 [Ostertagia ostertagi]
MSTNQGSSVVIKASAVAEPGTLVEVYRGRAPGAYVPGTPWRTWWRLFNNFLILRKVTDEMEQRLIFLQEIGGSNYELLESLLQGREPEQVPLKELSETMASHFQPKKLVLAERYGLMSRTQRPGQTLQDYYAELQKAAATCEFEKIKDHRDAMVTMVFIGGLASLETRKRLLERENLTSKEALEAAEAFERVGKNAPHLKEGLQEVGISVVQSNKGKFSKRKQDAPPPRARAMQNKSRVGEQAAGVKSSKQPLGRCSPVHMLWRKVSRRVNWCAEPSTSDLDEMDSSENNIDKSVKVVEKSWLSWGISPRGPEGPEILRSDDPPRVRRSGGQSLCQKVDPATMLRINIHGTDIACELDTGASVSILDVASWKRIGKPPLTEATIEATAYNNSPIQFCGKCTVWVQFNGRQAKMDLHVLEGATRTLCGRDMIRALKIDCGPHYQSVHEMQDRPAVKQRLAKILEENKSVFKPGLGRCVTAQATLKFKMEPVPKFFRARPVPLALRPKVEEKLKELTPLHLWEEPAKPWQRIHIDFCQTQGGEKWLIAVDAKSKWPEVVRMGLTTAERTIDKLRSVFATHGLPEQIVSDNGPPFSASDGRKPENVLTELLFEYRVTPHRATGKSPAEILMGRELRTTLDIRKTKEKANREQWV